MKWLYDGDAVGKRLPEEDDSVCGWPYQAVKQDSAVVANVRSQAMRCYDGPQGKDKCQHEKHGIFCSGGWLMTCLITVPY